MLARNPLVAVFAVAGLLAGARALAEDAASVFVPELALIDGGVCRVGPAGNPMLLRLAQAGAQTPAKKTEISPAAPAAAATAKPASADGDAPIISGLGKLGYKITTTSKEA